MSNTATTDVSLSWVEAFYEDVDKLDIEVLDAAIASDVAVQFGNNPAIEGKEAALETFQAFWSMITGMRHEREELVLDGDLGVLIGKVTYIGHDGSSVTVPVASHVRKNSQGKIDRLWVYIDLAPLFSRPG